MITPPILIFALLWAIVNWRRIGAIDCYQQPPTATYAGGYGNYYYNYNVFTCPTTSGNCFKYVCVGATYYVQRGCLDPYSPTQRCDIIDGQCRVHGGTGTCYTCSYNRCNGAPGKVRIHHWLFVPGLLMSGGTLLFRIFFPAKLI